jgi:flagellar P-ring protein precursor FlgI
MSIFFIIIVLIAPLFAQEGDAPAPAPITGYKKILYTPTPDTDEKVRIKDLASFEGVRENQLVGYGLVVGLNGTGDTLSSSPQTKESLTGMLERLGVNIREGGTPSGKNVAAVMVTATFHPFARHGSKIDVSVSAVGDAKDLRGGTLLVTPLLAADGEVYAVAQGAITVSGVTASGANASVAKGVPTSGFISNGAIVEKEIDFDINTLKTINLSLRNPDFTTSKRVAEKLNAYFNDTIAVALDTATIKITIPESFQKNVVPFMTEVEQLKVRPDQVARIVMDDANGVIVMGNNVRISPVAVNHGNITILVTETPSVSQPNVTIGAGGGASASAAAAATVLVGGPQSEDELKKQRDSLEGIFKAQLDALAGGKKTQTDRITSDNTLNDADKKIRSDVVEQQYNKELAELQTKQKTQMDELSAKQLELSRRNVLGGGFPGAGAPPETRVGLSGVKTEVVKDTALEIKEESGKFAIVDGGTTLEELVNALNALGVKPTDMGPILQAIKASGAMQAEIIAR